MPDAEPLDTIVLDGGLKRICNDARALLEYALTERRAQIPERLEPSILQKLTAVLYPRDLAAVSRETWNDFLGAYEALSIFTYPVTAQTLRNTEDPSNKSIVGFLRALFSEQGQDSGTASEQKVGTIERVYYLMFGVTASQRVSRLLWFSTSIFLGLIGATELIQEIVQERDTPIYDDLYHAAQLFTSIQPFLYGGLGACAYLLRSAHRLIAARAFNGCYRPEYLNRILLGVISGGTVSLFVDVGSGQETTGVALSKAALGFLAGYSTDFLFKTIERILEALLPRDGAAPPPAAAPRAAASSLQPTPASPTPQPPTPPSPPAPPTPAPP
jgi:hypothetical protein